MSDNEKLPPIIERLDALHAKMEAEGNALVRMRYHTSYPELRTLLLDALRERDDYRVWYEDAIREADHALEEVRQMESLWFQLHQDRERYRKALDRYACHHTATFPGCYGCIAREALGGNDD